MRQNQNIQIVSGDTKNITVNIVDGEGLSLPLNDVTIKWVLYNKTVKVLEKISTDGGILKTGVGKCVIVLSKNDTDDLSGNYQHYLNVEDSVGNSTTVLTGGVEAIKVPR